MKRQFFLLPPWVNEESTSSNAILLLEIPASEEFSFSLTTIDPNTVNVTIHAGIKNDSATRWCTSWVFICTPDGVSNYVFSGDEDINPPKEGESGENTSSEALGFLDWQEWAYFRDIEPPPAIDDFSRRYQQAYLPDSNRPPIDPNDEDSEISYLEFAPVLTNVSRVADLSGGESPELVSLSSIVFDVEDIDSGWPERALSSLGFTASATVKTSDVPIGTLAGSIAEVAGFGAGWSQVRILGSFTRVLAASALYE